MPERRYAPEMRPDTQEARDRCAELIKFSELGVASIREPSVSERQHACAESTIDAMRVSSTLHLLALLRRPEGRPRVHFNKNTGKFRILVFSDLHYGEGENKDGKSDTFQKEILEAEEPDMVVFNGDAISNYAAPDDCKQQGDCTEWFRAQWERFTSSVRELEIPYAYVMGNHDPLPDGIRPDGKDIISYDTHATEMSLSREPPSGSTGGSVYYVPIYRNSSVVDGAAPQALLWMLDSGVENCMGLKGWGCAEEDQIDWFKNMSKGDGLRDVQGLMFVHIPLQEVLLYWNAFGRDASKVIGIKTEDVSCSSVNTGLFAAAAEHSVTGIFHGHDHNNDFVAQVDMGSHSVRVGYGRKSGYGGYDGALADTPGATVIELELDDNKGFKWSSYTILKTASTAHTIIDQISRRNLRNRWSVQESCTGMS
ncbi:purple acid phosphatase [Perkinsus chesapeaki]|uniref:Purple acid phosphatase n=1 Tax=Perkinsus chesapeaki TaxID=330153 RepID=A0A7J6L3F6_PERCH|nr:purple acid phosphatase [Perkinsus chesapeaki]